MKHILVSLALLVSTVTHAWEQRPPLPIQQCVAHSPWGFAESKHALQPLCRTGYLSAYDAAAKIPNWVAYTLTPGNALGCQPRGNDFVADNSVKNGARPDDYTGTGYDRGHMSPDSDQAWSENTQRESYLMTNMVPQAGSLNRGLWKWVETYIRAVVVQHNTAVTIYVGSGYDPASKKIGRGVVVPDWYYKIVVNQKTGEIVGWVFPHRPPYPNLGNNPVPYRKSITQIQEVSGVKFMFPANAKELSPGQEWVIDFGKLTSAKRTACTK